MMLVSGKTSYQSVIIDDVIKGSLLYIKPGQVVLGTDTPDGAKADTKKYFLSFSKLNHHEIFISSYGR